MGLPIDYSAVIRGKDGSEGSVDLEEAGWRDRQDVLDAEVFTLEPKQHSGLPTISIHLKPFPDGTKKHLVYFSRVHGQVGTVPNESAKGTDLFRLYCVGWKATIGGCTVTESMWIYPGGSIVVTDEPPYVQELVEHYATKDLPHA